MRRPGTTTWTVSCLILAAAIALAADKPPVPNDDLDFLNKKALTAPASAPATLPKGGDSPFKPNEDDGRRPAVVTLSDGEKVRGRVSTTADKPIRIWDEKAKEYRDVPFELIKSMEARILWEREEKEWHFKESGSDLKEYTGKTYPARETEYIVTLVNGQSITGGIVAPLFVESPNGNDKTLVLHKRDKGPVGKTLKDLIYVKKVEFMEATEKK